MGFSLNEEKMGLGIGYAVAMVGAWLTTHWFSGLATSLTTIVGGLTGLYAIFCGAHVTNAWVQSKSGDSEAQDLDATSPFVEPHPEDNGK